VHLFYIQGANIPFENRKYHIKKNWLNKATNPRKFIKEYELYPFSLLKFHNRPLFRDGYEFLTIELEEFKKIVENYITPIIPKDLHYTHMYVFSVYGIEKNNIGFYRIEHLNHKNGEIEIKVTPPNNKTSLQLEPYEGNLKQQGNKLVLTFQNTDDYISAIFNLELINKRTDKLVGIGIGIADINQKIPIAKKVILTKKAIENIDELYLILNESEIISANENFYEYDYTKEEEFNQIHLKKYIKKIEQINSLFHKLSEQNYFNSFYQQLAYQELLATHKIFQKVKNDHSYYIYDRKRILDILIKSYKTEPYNKLYIVMPTYKEDNIFKHQSTQAIVLQNRLIELSKSVSIKIIFVIENCQEDLKQEFTTFLKKAKESIDIHFTFNKTVEQEVNSIDFCYTDRENFVV
ncbi:MAG: hypothetical protein KAU90_05035, partial [Sulfurovaceae bacterium]|nr:hypothetical protein [Sulfurovaceae bacterium]